MLNVVICDDQLQLVENIKKTVEGAILIEDMIDVQIELATTNPNEVLELFRTKVVHADKEEVVTEMPLKQRLIFLDINFGLDYPYLDGIKIASEIRKFDISSNIVFVTSSGEERADVLEQKIVALGYLKKSLGEDELREKIVDLLLTARQRMSMSTFERKMIEFKTGHAKRYVNLMDIYYLKGNDLKDKGSGDNEPRQGLTILCEANGISYLKRKLKFYDEEVPELVRLGRSYLVNPMNVCETRTSGRKGILTMANGEELSVLRESFNAYEEQIKEMREKGLL